MRFSRWLWTFFATVFLCALLFCGYNVVTDPFGVFGDRIFQWYDYDMTQNPRVAKIPYLEQHHDAYDSYIIGCSKTGGIPVEDLNAAFGGSFYSMLMYGGDMYDNYKTAVYLLENYDVKHIVLNLGLEETVQYDTEDDPIKGNLHYKVDGSSPLSFYGRYLFANPSYGFDKLTGYFEEQRHGYVQNENDVFTAETGTYDKSRRDAEHIDTPESYLAANAEAFPDLSTMETKHLSEAKRCLRDIARIKALCEEKGAEFTLLIDPVSEDELRSYDQKELAAYFTELAKITDYWNFCGFHGIAADERYFYDTYHFRTAVGSMMMDVISGDADLWHPEGFGYHVTAENAKTAVKALFTDTGAAAAEEYTRDIPILMYHSVSEDTSNGNTVTPSVFEEQIRGLLAAGYTSISPGELLDYVEKGTPLPEKPLLITLDDGYLDNYTNAWPILEKYQCKATIAVVGCSLGKDTYRDTDQPILPHFSAAQAKEMSDSGLITIISHSYDMHQSEKYEEEPQSSAVVRRKGESEAAYIKAFCKDYRRSVEEIERCTGKPAAAYAYPGGEFNELTEILLSQMGNKMSFAVYYAQNEAVKGLPQTLRALSRYCVESQYSAADIIELIGGNE